MREVTFIQYDVAPLTPGTYTVAVTHTAGQGDPDGFNASTTFAVSGERFKIDPAEIAGVFPPDLANGEYAGALPHVLFKRRTLPWERESDPGNPGSPWLAVLLLQDTELAQTEGLQQRTVKELVPNGQPIVATGSSAPPGVGAMPANTVSYPGLTTLDYGETPDDPVQTIDLTAAMFSAIAPARTDLPYLGHIRKVDDMDAVDGTGDLSSLAVVLGNRIPQDGTAAHALLVSIEGLAPLLPAADGTQSAELTAAIVRLTVFRAWRFFANTGGETFLSLVESIDTPPATGMPRLTSLQVPFIGSPPDSTQVAQPRENQAAGTATAADAQVLVHDAYGMGYLPLAHHLRHGGQTVSWYRGPLAPFAVNAQLDVPLAGPDAATRYNPQTGMFDISYAAAWQLGQLLAVQNRSFALHVLDWRRRMRADAAVRKEQDLIDELLGGAFESVTRRRSARIAAAASTEKFPRAIVRWLSKLHTLHGVPFNYLVPDERMLPAESLRTFHLDKAWMAALLDGALSIGRASTGELVRAAETAAALHAAAFEATRELRANTAPETPHVNSAGDVTGLLMRSQIVTGWPRLSIKAFSDTAKTTEIPKLRMAHVGGGVLLCLFDGIMADFEIREAPEQLHCGVEENILDGSLSTTLRQVVGDTPGLQYLTDPKGGPPDALVPARADRQTLMIEQAAGNIRGKLQTDFAQDLADFTSAEFALEMVKGVDEVEFRLGG